MVSSNTWHNVADISEMALDVMRNNLQFSSRVNRQYDKRFTDTGAKNGDTFNIRVPGQFKYRAGAVAQPTAYNDTYVPVTVSQGGVDLRITSMERTLNVDDFKQNILLPMMAPLFNTIDAQGLALVSGLNQYAGTVGTMPTDGAPFLQARSILEKQSGVTLDGQISAMIDGDQQVQVLKGLAGYLNPSKVIGDQYKNGSLGEAFGLDFFSTANAPVLTSGGWTAVGTTSAGMTDGGTSVTTSGWTSATLAVGDCFTIAGCYAINPVSKTLTNQLKQFTVTAAVVSPTATPTLTYSPASVLTGPLQNVSFLPTTGAAIYMYGAVGTGKASLTAGTAITNSIVFHRDAFVLALADLEDTSKMGANCQRMRDPKSGLNCRVTEWYDGTNDSAIIRLDVLFGWNILRQGLGARVIA